MMGWSGQMMRSRYNQPSSADASRGRLIKAIHAAARAKHIDDDLRHELQVEVTGKASLTAMTVPELNTVLDKINGKAKSSAPHRPWIGKIRALWWSLYWLGEVHDSGDRAIDKFVKRQGGVIALRFLDHRGAPAVIEALKAWGRRAGVEWPVGDEARGSRIAVFQSIASKFECADIGANWRGIARTYLGHSKPYTAWTDKEIDQMIKQLGSELRKVKGNWDNAD